MHQPGESYSGHVCSRWLFLRNVESCARSNTIQHRIPLEGGPLFGRSTPGQSVVQLRAKSVGSVFQFLELSPKLLSNENHWFTLMVVRSELVQKVSAGIGQCLKLLLESMFANDFGNPEHGLTLKGQGKSIRLFFTLAMTLQDGSAQKHTYSNRQDAGSRVCMLCKNIFP